ncbi:type II secretion system protein N [Hyphomonas oceanitis]|uniref:Type II secretion system protein N n=1 Tax=Hyphomonas oceanitis SCH89 TaxID=1280953 RepID=A0A059G5W5_9PROT|nr:type II secretion system protein N [Hyphomonas oceanitis]KDA01960.1 general secretion pathway protein N [Hyphomonas oceanitis SCH89]
MKRIALILVFAAALIVGLVSGIPLSFAMRNAGLIEQGIGWQQARGTIWHGQVTGLVYRGTPAGALDIRSSPLSLFTGSVGSDINWGAPTGRARLRVSISPSSVNLSNLGAEVDISRLDGIHDELRRVGGTLKLSNAAIRLGRNGQCTSANGSAQLDLVSRLGVQYGRDWPMLTGSPVCTDGTLKLPLSGDGQNGERFEITLSTLPDGRTSMDLHVEKLDPQATAALATLGFTKSGNGYTLRREAARNEEN